MTKPSPRARVALVGLGPIGLEVGRALATRGGIEFLGAADPAADIAGKKLMDLLPVAGEAGTLPVDARARDLYGRLARSREKTDVVVLCTGSRLDSVTPQIEEAIEAADSGG